MLFQTYEFLILMLVVLAGIVILRQARAQHWMLLVASYVFYAWWDVRFLILLLLTSMIDFSAALGIYGVQLSWRERIRLSVLLIVGAYLTLGLNWPAVQGGQTQLTVAEFFQPGWAHAPQAIAVIAAFAVIGPMVYSLYFRLSENGRRNAFLATSMIANLVILGFFKYFNFFSDNLVGLGHILGFNWTPPALDVALPVGISFYTFVTMSYGIDAYRGDIVPERSFLRMALFVSYFPHLVAGPIIRPEQLLPTLHEPWKLSPERLLSGFHLTAVGMVKKVLIADSIAPLVEVILGHPAGQPSLLIWIGTALFAVQIYCDFSGYTDVARGVSRMVGVELPLNFNFPYFSTSIIEFWRRWHISLSSWLRDYLYIPLGGGRASLPRIYFNLLTTMVLGGLWHGASWNFVMWGTYQGLLLCINRFFNEYKATSAKLTALFERPGMKVVCWVVTMYFVLLGWLIFRVTNLHDLLYAMRAFVLFDGQMNLTSLGLGLGTPVIALLAFLVFVVLHTSSYFAIRWSELLDRLPSPALTAAYVLLGLLFFIAWPSQNAPFIYFQF
ncbi:MAG TPA: MBOAT family O-acyltransferase [Pirellulales bacterium]|jgi:D-alanyl-lipoteichoic acid acyltransferase DltB (MBOAT superfamily)